SSNTRFAGGTQRAPPPERALTFGCAVVPARPAQGATLTLRKQRSPGLCRTSRSTLATAPFSDRHPRLAAPCNSSTPGKEDGPLSCGRSAGLGPVFERLACRLFPDAVWHAGPVGR